MSEATPTEATVPAPAEAVASGVLHTPWTICRDPECDTLGLHIIDAAEDFVCESIPDERTAPLLLAAPDFLSACTRERDTVPALDWLAAILTVVDGRFGTLAGGDPQALYTALQASAGLLAELRAAVAKAEGRES